MAKINTYPHTCSLGCDPEMFITNNGQVVGSERLIPKTGAPSGSGKIIQDGVQVEFNVTPETCRVFLGRNIASQFHNLKQRLEASGMKLDLTPVVLVPDKELAELSENSRLLGCAPSKHQYGEIVDMTLTPGNFNMRSAGGHVHISTDRKPEVLVPILDLFLGNTCVLLDRDPMQAQRRQLYGRAGEYRTPKYGIESRTLSNFWLRSYQLMTLVMGLARAANSVVYRGQVAYSAADTQALKFLQDKIDTDRLQAAINQNDFDLAMENYQLFKEFIREFVPNPTVSGATQDSVWPLWPSALRWWRYFVKMGIDHWFKKDPIQHWTTMPDGHGHGWEAFLQNTVRREYLLTHPETDEQKEQKKKEKAKALAGKTR